MIRATAQGIARHCEAVKKCSTILHLWPDALCVVKGIYRLLQTPGRPRRDDILKRLDFSPGYWTVQRDLRAQISIVLIGLTFDWMARNDLRAYLAAEEVDDETATQNSTGAMQGINEGRSSETSKARAAALHALSQVQPLLRHAPIGSSRSAFIP